MRIVVNGRPLAAASSSMVMRSAGGGVAAGIPTGYTFTMRTFTHRVSTRFAWWGVGLWALAVAGTLLGRLALGPIEVLLLFGPLVVVPLGLPLVLEVRPWTSGTMLIAAGLLVPALALDPPSVAAVLLSIPWIGLTLLLATRAVERWSRPASREAAPILRTVAVLWLPLAALHITLSCAGVSYAGIPPPLIELAGVHFTFAGFG